MQGKRLIKMQQFVINSPLFEIAFGNGKQKCNPWVGWMSFWRPSSLLTKTNQLTKTNTKVSTETSQNLILYEFAIALDQTHFKILSL